MTDPLGKLFGSQARLKLLRLFAFNVDESFTAAEAAARAQLDERTARAELVVLAAAGVVRVNKRSKPVRYSTHSAFPYMGPLRNLLLNMSARGEEVKSRLRAIGSLKLIVLSGVFTGDFEQPIDLLVVGDKIKERAFKNQVQKLESEMGKEIRYALLSTSDFSYRLNMSDKLIRDIFDFPHRIVLDKLDIGLK